MRAFTDAAAAMERLGTAFDATIETAIREIIPAGRTAASVSWTHDKGAAILTLVLDNGDVIRSAGPGRLEAILAAARALG